MRLGLLVEREVHWHSDKKRERLLRDARFMYPQAAIESIDVRADRRLEHRNVTALAPGDRIEAARTVLITGPTCALGHPQRKLTGRRS